jgi:hypothetical protein
LSIRALASVEAAANANNRTVIEMNHARFLIAASLAEPLILAGLESAMKT